VNLAGARVLVTGGRGFLGSHVCDALAARRPAVVLRPGSSEYDLTRPYAAERLVREARPDVVFHLAARVGGIGANAAAPGDFFRDNVLMGVQLLEACRAAGVAKVVVVGTACCYPEGAPLPLREDDLWSGYPAPVTAPYGLAKRAVLAMCQAYRAQHGCNFVFVVPTNLYGPRDGLDPERSHVLPAVVRRMAEAVETGADRVVLWGDGTPTRDLLYVADAAEALCRTAERYDEPAPLNLGTGTEVAVAHLADLVARAVGFRGEVRWDPSRPGGYARRSLDATRSRALLGFAPTTPLQDGIAATVAWYMDVGRHKTTEEAR
jgi:GDP-L-fucose synthase